MTTTTTQVHLTKISGNSKTGPIPVSTTSSETCPPTCGAFKVCYAKAGPLAMHWKKVSDGSRGTDWETFTKTIQRLPRGQVWRHNQSGDLPGKSGTINAKELEMLVKANKGKNGFTYTHKPLTKRNIQIIKSANDNGFTINASCDNVSDIDKTLKHGLPVVAIAPSDAPRKITTKNGNVSVGCPAAYREDTSCSNCGHGMPLCGRKDRKYSIHFPAHGVYKKKANELSK